MCSTVEGVQCGSGISSVKRRHIISTDGVCSTVEAARHCAKTYMLEEKLTLFFISVSRNVERS